MKKMTRPVMKHLAEINFKNWNRLDKTEKILEKALPDMYEQGKDFASLNYTLYKELTTLLTQVRNDVIFIDETFREYLEED